MPASFSPPECTAGTTVLFQFTFTTGTNATPTDPGTVKFAYGIDAGPAINEYTYVVGSGVIKRSVTGVYYLLQDTSGLATKVTGPVIVRGLWVGTSPCPVEDETSLLRVNPATVPFT